MTGSAQQFGDAHSGTNSALCPHCRRATKRGAPFCYGCFCKLPMGVRYMLADTHRRLNGIAVGCRILAEIEKRAAAQPLFEGRPS